MHVVRIYTIIEQKLVVFADQDLPTQENVVQYCELKLEEEAMHTTTHHDTV